MTDDLFSSLPEPPCPACRRPLAKCAKEKDCAEQAEFRRKARERFEEVAREWERELSTRPLDTDETPRLTN